MSKQLAAAIAITAPSADGFIYARAGGSSVKVAPKNAHAVCEQMTIIRKPRKGGSKVAEKRVFPKFTPGMSTGAYVTLYHAMNAKVHLSDNWDEAAMSRMPCQLYEHGALDFFPIEEQIEEMPPVSPQIDAMTDDELIEAIGVEAPEVQAVAEVQEVAEVAEAPEVAELDNQTPASPEFAALMARAREAKRIAMEAIKKARVSSAQAVPDQDGGNPYPYLQPLEDNRGGGVAAAKNIRQVLKNEFPGVKFRVRSDYSSVNVYWTDGPTARAVDGALAPFDIGHSDCQTDYFYTEKTRFSDTFGGVQYLFTHRELSPDAIKASIAAVFGDNGPTYEEWKNGTPWPSVANKGAWHDSTMCDHYEWLAMVRRHANGTD